MILKFTGRVGDDFEIQPAMILKFTGRVEKILTGSISACSSPSNQSNTTESINHNSAGKSKTDNCQILDDNACNNALTTHASGLNSCETENENNEKFLLENDAEANAVHVGHTLMITDNTGHVGHPTKAGKTLTIKIYVPI